ncbi:MAG: hypothetical protein LUD18_00675 [Lachnospiraceae bacterium]|nr:hypothetical protein [Lachnospiraceae bacterium]
MYSKTASACTSHHRVSQQHPKAKVLSPASEAMYSAPAGNFLYLPLFFTCSLPRFCESIAISHCFVKDEFGDCRFGYGAMDEYSDCRFGYYMP